MKKITRLNKVVSGLLACVMTTTLISGMPVVAENSVEKYPYTMFASSDIEGAINISADNICINGNIATNGTIVSSGNMNVNGSRTENTNEEMIYLFNKIDSQYFSKDSINEYTEDYAIEENNIIISEPILVDGEFELNGSINLNTGIKAIEDITINGEVQNTNNSLVFSQYGDIVINSMNSNINGLIYAPFGNVEITGENLNLNNICIIADTITINCPSVNANNNDTIAKFVGTKSEDYVIPYEDYVYFLESDDDIYGSNLNSDELSSELINYNSQLSNYANVDIEYYGETVTEYISDLSEIYGREILSLTNLSYDEIAKKMLSAYLNIESNQIILSEPLNLKDANDVITYIGFNYYSDDASGYITIATHTKEVLIRDMVEDTTLPEEFGDLYYLSTGEFYYCNNGYYTLDGVYIDEDEFKNFLIERKSQYYNFTLDILSDLEAELISQLNNIIYIDAYDFESESLQKSYSGQSGSGYGGIDNCAKYLKARYGGTITKSSSKSLSMANFKQSYWSDNNNCTLAAITRVLYYHRQNGYTKIDSTYSNIYKKVKKVAKKYGYTQSGGTGFTKINNIVDDVLKDYGYGKSKCKGIYVWTFDGQVKKEIDAKRPVVMNIARGYYGNHTITVCGYAKYKRTKKILGIKTTKTYNMIEVYDGWSTSKKYIDYSAFAYDLISSGFGSFNTITMKK